MRKQSLLLIAAGLLATTSCNTETGNADEANAKIDSMVDARVDEIRMQLKAENDSIINELAMWRADSIVNARKGKTVVKKKPKPMQLKDMNASGDAAAVEVAKPKGGVSDRPGASNTGGGGVSDRPGASNTGNGGVNDRPGSTNNK